MYFVIVNSPRADQTGAQLFAVRVDVNAPRPLRAARIYAERVNIEDECWLVGRGFEPVDVILEVGNAGILADAEFPVDRRLDNEVLFLVFQAIVVSAIEKGPDARRARNRRTQAYLGVRRREAVECNAADGPFSMA